MSKTVRKYDRFQYFEEDCDCEFCLHNEKKGRNKKRGCGCLVCQYGDIRIDAIVNGRIKREKGWNRWLE